MKLKERKEKAAADILKIRRTADVWMVEAVLRLNAELNREIDLHRGIYKWALIRDILESDFSAEELSYISSFYRGIEISKKKKEAAKAEQEKGARHEGECKLPERNS